MARFPIAWHVGRSVGRKVRFMKKFVAINPFKINPIQFEMVCKQNVVSLSKLELIVMINFQYYCALKKDSI